MLVNQRQSERLLDIDFVRVIACFAVILIHVSSDYVELLNVNSSGWWVANFYDSISRFCVPIFIMVSGAILLDREPEKYHIKNRVVKIVKPYLGASLIYTLYHIFLVKDFEYKDFFIKFLNGESEYHLWFFYIILNLYIITPILLGIKQLSSNKILTTCLLIIFWHNMSIYLNYFWGTNISFLDFKDDFWIYISYYILGYLMYRRTLPFLSKLKNNWWIYLSVGVFLLSTTAIAVATGITSINQHKFSGEFFYGETNILVVIMSVSCFINLCWLGGNIGANYAPYVRFLSSISLGIYIIHVIVLEELNIYLLPVVDKYLGLNLLGLKILIQSIATFFISSLVVYLLRKWKPIHHFL
jgi:surface polysaccharide O-acyltransferase-like enzyme